MTSAEVTTTVSEESESVTEASTVGDDAIASEKTTTASVIDGESSTLSQDEESMEETTTSGQYDESVNSTPSGMDDKTTAADMDTEITTRSILPRIDDSQETTTSIIVEVPADTSVPNIDSDSLVTETTPVSEDTESITSIPLITMRVISVEDEGDSVTVVTMRPSTDATNMDTETSENSDATTTMQPIMEDDPDISSD